MQTKDSDGTGDAIDFIDKSFNAMKLGGGGGGGGGRGEGGATYAGVIENAVEESESRSPLKPEIIDLTS